MKALPAPPANGFTMHMCAVCGDIERLERDVLEVTAFAQPDDYGEHFKQRYGPTIVARGNAEKEGRAEEFDQALSEFCGEWNRGSKDAARFEMEYLLAVGRKKG